MIQSWTLNHKKSLSLHWIFQPLKIYWHNIDDQRKARFRACRIWYFRWPFWWDYTQRWRTWKYSNLDNKQKINTIFLWRSTKLRIKSIANKLDLSTNFVKNALKTYKKAVKKLCILTKINWQLWTNITLVFLLTTQRGKKNYFDLLYIMNSLIADVMKFKKNIKYKYCQRYQ